MEEQKTHQENQTDTSTETVPASLSTAGSTPGKKMSGGVMVLVLAGALVIAAGLYYYLQSDATDTSLNSQSTETGLLAGAKEYPEVVAKVNGEELSNEDFVRSLTQVNQAAAEQGADLTDASVTTQLETQAMDTLVNTTLLIQAAEASDIEISKEAVAAELEKIAGQFESEAAFAAAVAALGLDDESLHDDIRRQLLINEFLATDEALNADAVSAEEVQQLYDTLAAGQEGLPPLEEIYAAIEQELTSRKQQELISNFIQGLRDTAEIEVLI